MNKIAGCDILKNILWKDEAAQALNSSTRTLDRWHTLRTGPPRFLVGGKVAYDLRDVIAWLEDQKAKTAYYSMTEGES